MKFEYKGTETITINCILPGQRSKLHFKSNSKEENLYVCLKPVRREEFFYKEKGQAFCSSQAFGCLVETHPRFGR